MSQQIRPIPGTESFKVSFLEKARGFLGFLAKRRSRELHTYLAREAISRIFPEI